MINDEQANIWLRHLMLIERPHWTNIVNRTYCIEINHNISALQLSRHYSSLRLLPLTFQFIQRSEKKSDEIDRNLLKTEFEVDVLETVSPSTWAADWHLQALGTVLNRLVQSVFPECGRTETREYFDAVFVPRRCDPEKDCVTIMWTRTGDSTTPFIPNHFVPLISVKKTNCSTIDGKITNNGNLYNLSLAGIQLFITWFLIAVARIVVWPVKCLCDNKISSLFPQILKVCLLTWLGKFWELILSKGCSLREYVSDFTVHHYSRSKVRGLVPGKSDVKGSLAISSCEWRLYLKNRV